MVVDEQVVMNPMVVTTVALVLRHALTAVGALGVMTGTQLEAIVGGAAVVVGLGWSWWSKRK